MSFKFELGSKVTIKVSGETGEVIGRADYTHAGNNYYVRYKATDGSGTESWWQEDALQHSAE